MIKHDMLIMWFKNVYHDNVSELIVLMLKKDFES
jgi:hypothetical protein